MKRVMAAYAQLVKNKEIVRCEISRLMIVKEDSKNQRRERAALERATEKKVGHLQIVRFGVRVPSPPTNKSKCP